MKTAIVTGATGFIGGHVVRDLLAAGWDVHAVVRPSSDVTGLPAACSTLVHDGDAAALTDSFRAVQPTVVIHLATTYLATHTSADIPALVESNVTFGTAICDAALESGARGIVNAGTYWEHFDDAGNAVNLYAATKQAFSRILDWYVDAGQLGAISLKLFDTYGADDPRRKIVTLLLDAARSGEFIGLSPGDQLIDLLHVSDASRAFLAAAERLATGDGAGRHEVYGLSSGRRLSIQELAAVVETVTGRTIDGEWGYRPHRHREVMVPWTAPGALPGWVPSVSLEDGIKSLL